MKKLMISQYYLILKKKNGKKHFKNYKIKMNKKYLKIML